MSIIYLDNYRNIYLSQKEREDIFVALKSYFTDAEQQNIDFTFHQLPDIHVNVLLIICRTLQTPHEGQKIFQRLMKLIHQLDTTQINLYLLLHHAFENPLIFRCLNAELSRLSYEQLEMLLTLIEEKFNEEVPLLKLLRLSLGNIPQTKTQES